MPSHMSVSGTRVTSARRQHGSRSRRTPRMLSRHPCPLPPPLARLRPACSSGAEARSSHRVRPRRSCTQTSPSLRGTLRVPPRLRWRRLRLQLLLLHRATCRASQMPRRSSDSVLCGRNLVAQQGVRRRQQFVNVPGYAALDRYCARTEGADSKHHTHEHTHGHAHTCPLHAGVSSLQWGVPAAIATRGVRPSAGTACAGRRHGRNGSLFTPAALLGGTRVLLLGFHQHDVRQELVDAARWARTATT